MGTTHLSQHAVPWEMGDTGHRIEESDSGGESHMQTQSSRMTHISANLPPEDSITEGEVGELCPTGS